MAACSEVVVYAVIIRLVDPSFLSVAWGFSPMVLVVLMSLSHRGTGAYLLVGPMLLGMLALGGVGFGLVALSQEGELTLPSLSGRAFLGAVLALGAKTLSPLNAYGIRWGRDLASSLGARSSMETLFGPLAAGMLANLAFAPVSFLPVVSLVWLFLLGEVGVARLDWLLLGLFLVVFSNLLVQFRRT